MAECSVDVWSLSGKHLLHTRVSPGEKVESLMQQLEEATGVPPIFQQLVADGQVLAAVSSLEEQGVTCNEVSLQFVAITPNADDLNISLDATSPSHVRYLLRCRADPKRRTRHAGMGWCTPLELFTRCGDGLADQVGCIDALLEARAEPHRSSDAAATGSTLYVRALLDRGGDPDELLVYAIDRDRDTQIPPLLEARADLERRSEGEPLLSVAALRGAGACAKMLLSARARADQAGSEGLLPLHVAAMQAHRSELIGVLVAGRADPNLASSSGSFPVHIATHRGYADCLSALLQAKADPNRADNHGDSATHIAARCGLVSCLEPLLGARADPLRADASGSSPVHLTTNEVAKILDAGSSRRLQRANRYSACLKLLLAARADGTHENRSVWDRLSWEAGPRALGLDPDRAEGGPFTRRRLS